MEAMEGQQTIGIVGGGQLARMLTMAALPLGFKVVVANPQSNSPAAQAGAEEIVGDLYDSSVLKQLAEKADYLTIEIEHLAADVLSKIATLGKPVNPAPSTISLIQDKLKQKKFLQAAGIPVADFTGITNEGSAVKALKKYGGKMLLKSRHGAYDGRGNMVVKNLADVKKAFRAFDDHKLYAEKFVPFQKELAVMVARGIDGKVAAYPPVETIHARNICLEVLVPAPVSAKTARQAYKLALKVADLLEGAGVFGIEMFLTKEGRVLVNEIAPRVHNSGHYTLDASRTSQFEQHVRAITGLPLGSTDLVAPAAVMINVLGERNGTTKIVGIADSLSVPHVSVHLYGKSPTKVDRKMGHITATGKTVQQARARARRARKKLSI